MPHARVGDIDLFYELVDYAEPWKAAPAPIVLIHGLGGDQTFWLYQVPAFCAHFPVLSVDLRGHGQSAKPDRDFSIVDLARDVVRLLRGLGVERAHIVGLSLGGVVAQQFALDYPLAVASLVLADTFCGTPPEYGDMVQAALQFIEDNDMPAVAKARITNAFSDGVDPVMRDYFIDRVARNDKPSYLRAARAVMGFSSSVRLSEIAAPTLVVIGELDRVTPPALSEDIAARIPGARLARIAACGHISNLEKPAAFNRTLLEFLGSIAG